MRAVRSDVVCGCLSPISPMVHGGSGSWSPPWLPVTAHGGRPSDKDGRSPSHVMCGADQACVCVCGLEPWTGSRAIRSCDPDSSSNQNQNSETKKHTPTDTHTHMERKRSLVGFLAEELSLLGDRKHNVDDFFSPVHFVPLLHFIFAALAHRRRCFSCS